MVPSLATFDQGTLRRRLLIGWAVAFAVAALIVFGSVGQRYVDLTMRHGRDVSFWRMSHWGMLWWFSWALLAPFIFEWANRFSLRGVPWRRNLLLLALGCLVAFTIHVGIQVAAMYTPRWNMEHATLGEAVGHHTITSLYLNLFIYAFIVGVAHAVQAYQQAQQRALRAVQLESELANAQLDVLRAQLHPHFLFNTLNGISTLMYRDVATADQMVTRLSRLLRRGLDCTAHDEVPLGEEVAFLKEYLAIEQLRFGDEMTVHVEIAPGLEAARVPSCALQPLAENAIKHGLVPHGNAGTITVQAFANGEKLHLVVADDGPGLAPASNPLQSGVGLSNLHARLSQLYEGAFELHLRTLEPTGLAVELVLPLRRSSQPAGVQPGEPQVVPPC